MVSGSHKTKKTHLLRVVTKLWRLLRHCLFKQRESIELVDVVCGAVGIDDVHESSTRGTRWRVVSLLAVSSQTCVSALPDHLSFWHQCPQLLCPPDVLDKVFYGDQALEARDHVAILG